MTDGDKEVKRFLDDGLCADIRGVVTTDPY